MRVSRAAQDECLRVDLHPGVGSGAPVDVGVADDEEDVLGPAQRHARDALDVLEAELGNGLARLLLVARLHHDRGAGGDACARSSSQPSPSVSGVLLGDVVDLRNRILFCVSYSKREPLNLKRRRLELSLEVTHRPHHHRPRCRCCRFPHPQPWCWWAPHRGVLRYGGSPYCEFGV